MTTPTLTLSRVDNRTWMLLLELGGRSISLPLDRSSDPVALATAICGLIAESGTIRVTVDAEHVAPAPAAKMQPALLTGPTLLGVIVELTHTPVPATIRGYPGIQAGATVTITT